VCVCAWYMHVCMHVWMYVCHQDNILTHTKCCRHKGNHPLDFFIGLVRVRFCDPKHLFWLKGREQRIVYADCCELTLRKLFLCDLRMYVCVRMYVFFFVCVRMYVCVCVCVYVCMYVCVLCMHVRTYVCVIWCFCVKGKCMYACMHECMYVCARVYLWYIYIYIYTYIQTHTYIISVSLYIYIYIYIYIYTCIHIYTHVMNLHKTLEQLLSLFPVFIHT
jgi:hypothetical protein